MVIATELFAEDLTKPTPAEDVLVTFGHFREITRIAEHEIHEVVLSCTRARRQMLVHLTTTRPTLH